MEPVVYGVVFLKYIFISLLGSLKVSFLEVLDLIWKKNAGNDFSEFSIIQSGREWKEVLKKNE